MNAGCSGGGGTLGCLSRGAQHEGSQHGVLYGAGTRAY